MTGAKVIDRVRRQVSDSVPTFRFPDKEAMVLYLDDGIRAIVAEHPESRYETDIVTEELPEFTDISKDVGLTEDWNNSLVHFVSGRLLQEDGEDSANNALANDHYGKTGLRLV